jgi:hypothetical protein
VPWRHIASKWNKLCSKHGYCATFKTEDEVTNDAATQIKAIKNENDLAKTIGGYITKGSIEEKNRFAIKKKKFSIQEVIQKYPFISCNLETHEHYSRFIEGRVWGCSENLSNIKCFTSALDIGFQDTEHQFFHANKVQRLSSIMSKKASHLTTGTTKEQQALLQLHGIDPTAKKFDPFRNIFVHRHLKFCKIPESLQHFIAEQKLLGKFTSQKYFTIDSLS